MKYFLKLNTVSILYALMIFALFELIVNEHRISRITGFTIDKVNTYIGVSIVVGILLGTISLFFLTKKWLRERKANFWTIILWFPYFVLFILLFAKLFPINYGGDDPGPGVGLLILGVMMFFPIYILFINLVGYLYNDKASD
jgi:hypothetical protein